MASLHPRVHMILTADIEMGWRESHQQLPCLALYGPIAGGGSAAFARARRSHSPARASCAEEAAGLLAQIPLVVRKRVQLCGEGFPQTLVAERLAECCLPRCGQLCGQA